MNFDPAWMLAAYKAARKARRLYIDKRYGRRPSRPTPKKFSRWVSAVVDKAVDNLMEIRIATYRDDISRIRGIEDRGESIVMKPLTRGDFLAYIFAEFTYALEPGDSYSAFSTFEFWDAMGLEGSKVYSDANIDKSKSVEIRRVMLVRSGTPLEGGVEGRTRRMLNADTEDEGWRAIQERLREHEGVSALFFEGDQSRYRFSYACVPEDSGPSGYYALRKALHFGFFEYKFNKGATRMGVQLKPVYYGETEGKQGRSRLKGLSIQLVHGESKGQFKKIPGKGSDQYEFELGGCMRSLHLLDSLEDVRAEFSKNSR